MNERTSKAIISISFVVAYVALAAMALIAEVMHALTNSVAGILGGVVFALIVLAYMVL